MLVLSTLSVPNEQNDVRKIPLGKRLMACCAQKIPFGVLDTPTSLERGQNSKASFGLEESCCRNFIEYDFYRKIFFKAFWFVGMESYSYEGILPILHNKH